MSEILVDGIEYNRYHVDFGSRGADYARYRRGFPPELFRRLAGLGLGRPGQRVVDLGTGTGTLARGFAEAGCEVVGVDVSRGMLEAARALPPLPGLSFRAAPAEATGLEGGAWDVVSAGQCWHWFDRPAAAAEARRLLRPGGALLIAHLDWLSRPGNVVQRSVALAESHNPDYVPPLDWPDDGIYSRWLPGLEAAGFSALEVLAFDVDLIYSPEAWRGRMRASAVGGAGRHSPERTEAFDRELARLLAEDFPGERLRIPHRVFAAAGFVDRAAIAA